MKTFHVTLMRDPHDGKNWLAHAEEDERAHTFGRNLDEVKRMAVDAVSLWFDLNPEEFEIVWNVELPSGLEKDLEQLHVRREELAALSEDMYSLQRRLALRLVNDLELTYRDAADLLGLSYQRVAQLVTG